MRIFLKNKVFSMLLIVLLLVGLLGGCAFLFNVKQNEESSQEKTDSSTDIVDISTLTYIAFGDSITYGWDSSISARMDKPYPTCVADELGLKAFSNEGISGSTITLIEGLPDINSQVQNATAGYDIVSVMIGVNDFSRSAKLGTTADTGLSTVYGSLNTLVAKLKAKYPDAYIFFITPLPCHNESLNSSTLGVSLEEVVLAIKDVCNRNAIDVLDLNASGKFTMENDPFSDGIHPSQTFIKQYTAPQIATFIKENYK